MYRPAFVNTQRLVTALLLCLAFISTATAQENRYRAEIVLFERLSDPILQEQMAGKRPSPTPGELALWVVDANGNRLSDLDLVSDLTLNAAANRLENSGKYRVLMKAGWVQEFPPDYNGEPMRIEVGEFLEEAGHRAVEGTIEVDRDRFLLVSARLNHWRATQRGAAPAQPASEDSGAQRNNGSVDTSVEAQDLANNGSVMTALDDKELITWIRETRRMRSQEIHFLDSPTIGVLVYFHKLED